MSDLRKVTVVWSGGWDDLEVDLDTMRDMTPEELALIADVPSCYSPCLGNWQWLRCGFAARIFPPNSENKVVKITRRLGGGD